MPSSSDHPERELDLDDLLAQGRRESENFVFSLDPFNDEDQARYNACSLGEIFRPRCQPAGVWLQVDDYVTSPLSTEALPLVKDPSDDDGGLLRMCNIIKNLY